MAQALLGNCGFADVTFPVAGKSEWGMDTLQRRLSGHVSLLEAFMATLMQGQIYVSNGNNFYLQSWESDDSTPVATVTLNYKGLRGGTPIPDIQRQVVSAVGRVSADYSDETGGLGRAYRKDLLWAIGDTVPGPGSFGTTAAYERQRYTTGAVMEFTYKAMQTTYRYIKTGQPVGPQYSTVGVSYTQVPEDVRIITADGSIYGQIGWQQFFDLFPVQTQRVVSFEAKQVLGSPYWECEDVIRLELGDPA